MRNLIALSAAALLALTAGTAEAKGCLKGAAVGGVAGQFLGHHPVAGAAVGCVVGHHHEGGTAETAPRGASSPLRAP